MHRELLEAPAIYLDANALVQSELEGSPVMILVGHLAGVPMYSSMLAFAEFVKVLTRKTTKKDAAAYMHVVRNVMAQFERGELQRVEPTMEKPQFIFAAQALLAKYQRHGGPDVWHVMAALELSRQVPGAVFLTFDAPLARDLDEEGLVVVDGNEIERDALVSGLKAMGRWPVK